MYAAHVHREDDGDRLDLLVLLRGEPGWYARTPRGGSLLTGATEEQSGGRTLSTYWTSGAGTTVTFGTDSSVRTVHLTVVSKNATIVDEQVETDSVNVVLLDGMSGGDPPKLQTLLVDPRLSGPGSAAARAIRKRRSLVDFVQCGVPLPADIPDAEEPLGRSLRGQISAACAEIISR
jgi:hypothetical protein